MTVENRDVYITLGSNLGDSARTLLEAWDFLGKNDGISLTTLSPPFLSAPVDMISDNWFINAAGRLTSFLTPHSLLDVLLETESVFGRTRDSDAGEYQDRTVDLDLLYFGSLTHDDSRLTLPHPCRFERLFVLAPMATIAPTFIDPEHMMTMTEMYQQLHEKIKHGDIASQEIKISSWPEDH